MPAKSPTRHLDPPRPCPLSLQASSPARPLYKAVSTTWRCPGLSPVAKVGDLADIRKQFRHDANNMMPEALKYCLAYGTVRSKAAAESEA
jgi:hypothetical protein